MRSKQKKPFTLTDLQDATPSEEAEAFPAPAPEPAQASIRPPPPEHVAAMEKLKANEEGLAGLRRSAEATPSRPPRTGGDGWARYAYPIAVAAALTWAGGLVAFVLGFQSRFGAFDYGALQWVVIGALAAMPAAFILLAAAAMRQGARLAAETRRARDLADDLAIPAALAADQTGGAMDAMRREIENASVAALEAQEPIAALRAALAEESRKLTHTAAEARETGREIAETLGRERAALSELAAALQAQAAEAVEALTLQTRVVADTSDLAQAQLQEAQAALASRAADLAVAAGDASQTALMAGDKLAAQVERLEATGGGVSERLNRLQLTMARERDELNSLSESLRIDQEDLAVQMETRRAQLVEAAAEAREGAAVLGEASDAGSDALRSLIATAAEEVRRLAETAHREQEVLDAKARSAVGLFTGAVAEERATLEAKTLAAIDQLAAAAEEARMAAAGHVESAALAAAEHVEVARARIDELAETAAAKIDDLGETAFAAGRKADEVFDARMAAARRLIDQSAALVDESGRRSAERIEAGLASTRAALDDIQGLLAEVDARFDRIPDEARQRAEAVREAVERGVSDLTAAARAAAEETQAIDAVFQERVRRNYEVLSEAVRLMGRVAGAAGPPLGAEQVSRPTPPVQTPVPGAAQSVRPDAEPEVAREPVEVRSAVAVGERALHVSMGQATTARADPLRPAALAEPIASAREPARAYEPTSAGAAGLRPRLRLTPASDEPGVSMFKPQQPTPEPTPRPAEIHAPKPDEPADTTADEWTWKDLLSTMDDPVDDEALAERLMGEISALGIDAGALLPRSRVDEIAAVLQAGDGGGAREVVRRLAPAAVRRLSRRVLTDRALRGDADKYVRRYEKLLGESAARDREGYMISALLGSEPGRAFLLLDAAIGDLA